MSSRPPAGPHSYDRPIPSTRGSAAGKDIGSDMDQPGQQAGSTTAPSAELSARDLAVLAFERAWWRRGGRKDEAIREEFGFSAARYYQLLGALIQSPAALREDPMLVKRLQRLRDARTVRRADLLRRHSS